ncbi:hypothetical protein AN958_05193 [Leucoagaricus sp. SymC.cos]|nr:hypothetical protein AN958_05193 [Leucoagaricus sp. SymC.cos]
MSLAQRLNELAAAHAQHLISDDDWRLLRKDLLEKHAAEPTQTTPKRPQVQALQPQPAQPAQDLPLRRKQSVVSGVAKLFRRATGRSPKKQPPAVVLETPCSDSAHLASPRRPSRKPSLLSVIRSDLQPSSPQPSQDQDDPAALRAAIVSAEAEHTRLLDAFTSLESSTLKRIQYKTARRLYTPTPTNVSVLIEGREWRKHTKPVPSIVLPPPPQPNHRHHPHPLALSTPSSTGANDQLSIHSAASSSKISLARSFTSLPRQQPLHSQLTPHPRILTHSLQRQNSVSSASTQSTGASSRLVLGPRSVGNLYLTSLAERISSDTVAESRITEDTDEVDIDDPEATDYESALNELNDIRRRRDELNARYASKLEYLKAKLRAAELHERVVRR